MKSRIQKGIVAGVLGVLMSASAWAAPSPDRLMKELKDVAGALRSGHLSRSDLQKAGLPSDGGGGVVRHLPAIGGLVLP